MSQLRPSLPPGTVSASAPKRGGSKTAASMTAHEFASELQNRLRLQGRQAMVRVEASWGPRKDEEVYVNFVNLPEGVGSAGGGAEAENNRSSYWIRGFGPASAPAAAKVKVEESNTVFRTHRMRAKTGAPEAVARTLADHLNKLVAEVPPRFTHTERR
jgi:hypothetical protein